MFTIKTLKTGTLFLSMLSVLVMLAGCGGGGGGGGGGAGAAPGSLDTSFGTNGIVITPIGNSDSPANAMAIQSDGKIVAAGSFSLSTSNDFFFVLARYNSNGSLDTSFGGDGIQSSTGLIRSRIQALAIQPDGKIVAAGSSELNGFTSFTLARYNTDGSPDILNNDSTPGTSFGTNGTVITRIGSNESIAKALAIQSDGKIVAAGTSVLNGVSVFTLARYNTNGTLDTSFGTTGIAVTPISNRIFNSVQAIAIQSDSKIVVAGSGSDGSNREWILIRYNTNGTLDTSFGTSGTVLTPTGFARSEANAMAIQSDGKIVVGGVIQIFALARYNTNGTLDMSFGTSGTGIVTTPVASGGLARSLAIQSDGKIVAAGRASSANNTDFTVVRYNANGGLDTSFGANGIVITPIGNSISIANAVAIQSDGKIVAVGAAGNTDFALVRYHP